MPTVLSDPEITEALRDLPGWSAENDQLVRSYTLSGHLPAVAMLVHIASVQEELNHHADLGLVYNRLTLAVNTHSEGGKVTELDTELARRVEALAAGHGAS